MLVTIIDVLISAASEFLLTICADNVLPLNSIYIISNTLGIISGFIIQYFLTARHVYNVKNLRSFIVFLATFFVNLLMADTIIFIFRTLVFDNANTTVAFLSSKLASIVFPFFITYFIRKKLMPTVKEKSNE